MEVMPVLICFLQIVKFCQPGQERVSPPGDVDIGIYQLQRSEKLLGERVQKLGLEADRCDSVMHFKVGCLDRTSD